MNFLSAKSSVFILCLFQIVNCRVTGADTHYLSRRSVLVLQDYAKFQISSGKAGNCAARAAAVFLTPYKVDRVDLNPVGLGVKGKIPLPLDRTDLDVCNRMTKAASDAETNFNAAILANPKNSVISVQLQNGKICNKVLKLTGSILCLQMEVELGLGTPDRVQKISAQFENLKKDIKIDQGSENQIQRSFLNV